MRNRYYDPNIGRFITKDPILDINPAAKLSPIVPENLAMVLSSSAPLSIRIDSRGFISKDPSIQLYLQPRKISLKLTSFPEYSSMLYFPNSLHSYLYIQNNPVNLVDPLGLSCDEVCNVFWGIFCSISSSLICAVVCYPTAFPSPGWVWCMTICYSIAAFSCQSQSEIVCDFICPEECNK